MKTLYTLLLFLASVTCLSAQIQKGSVLVGGTVGFNNYTSGPTSSTIINLSPSMGFFLSNQFALGASLDANFLITGNSNATSLGFVPFARGYFNKSGNNRFFGQVDLGIQSAKSGDSESLNALLFGIGVGADFFLNEFVAIEGFLGYTRSQYLDTNIPIVVDYTNSFGLNFGVAAFISRAKATE